MESKVYIGTAGWDYPDWRGVLYPKSIRPLTYLATYFNLVEVNSTFYRPASAQHVSAWIKHVEKAKSFTFSIKLWSRFTHQRIHEINPSEVRLFNEGILPLKEAQKLDALLIQFPWSFKNTQKEREYLWRLLDCFMEFPLALEVRHSTWIQPEILEELEHRNVCLCNIDQPLFHCSLAPDSLVTSDLGYVRLHGRNQEDWFREDASRNDRYNYLYTEEELTPWVESIRKIREKVKKLMVVTNNHYRGQAAVNALQIKHKLKGAKVLGPPLLINHYPQLKGIAISQGPDGQRSLF